MLNNLSKITLYVLIGITVVVSVLFFWGGAVDEYAEYIEPNYTQAMMILMYVLFGIAILITLVSLLIAFLENFKVDKKTATKPLISIFALLALVGFAWLIADGSPMQILGLDVQPTENEIKFVDVQIKAIYLLSGVAVLSMFLSFFTKRLK
ncbi:MAG TPA: hypothetical protein PKW38_04130 [Paludibacteraceae bacterium]|nr:hypothetical protein [Paludibacteraceae bacterium]HOH74945.1 hypothetical protein [Paludibacteraceae bacterium]